MNTNPGDTIAIIIFCIFAYVMLSIMEAPKQRKLHDYIARKAMEQWMEWVREYERTGRWNGE